MSTDGKHEAVTSTFWSKLGAQAKKAYAGGIAGAGTAIAAISFTGFFADGQIDTGKIAAAAGSIVTGFVGGFLLVFFAPKNHPDPLDQEPQPAFTAPSTVDYRTEQGD
jgi:NhaP-type Na+/H+ or K+/H+ antiporter